MEFIVLTEVDEEGKPAISSFGVLRQDYYDTIEDAIYYLTLGLSDNSEVTFKKRSNSFAITVISSNGKTVRYEMAQRQTLTHNKD